MPESAYCIARVEGNGWAHAGGEVDTGARTVSVGIAEPGVYAVRRAPPTEPCTAPEHRQFDFWVGEWQVGPTQSSITLDASGCTVHEHWKGQVPGKSISVYDPRDEQWHQTYFFGPGGPVNRMSGGLTGQRMEMFVRANGVPNARWTWRRR